MDGLLDYANIFAFWMQQLSLFWDFLQTRIDIVFLDSILELKNKFAVLPVSQPVLFMLDVIELAFTALIEGFGIQELSVLGFIFAMMGVAFGFYFIITLIQWLLKTIPLA